MSFTKTTEGLIKAAMQIAAAPERARKRLKPRYTYTEAGFAVHGKRYLSPAERKALDGVMEALGKTEDQAERDELLVALRAMPVTFVPVKKAEIIDRSRYTGERLRQIAKAGGGAKERARAARRAALALVAPPLPLAA